ncbi:hypothetical protein ACFQ6N_20795 [Kitasatospora sp. NPDC056446]|uniref:hypothetical protein n=1 Tax=Kitasatospora sp. NPDC056446 TaxID=3345819 RepID=UPI0036ABF2C4
MTSLKTATALAPTGTAAATGRAGGIPAPGTAGTVAVVPLWAAPWAPAGQAAAKR